MSAANQNPVTPGSLGYRMPAEWAPHRATWLSWPHNQETWPTQLEKVREVWVRMIRELSQVEQICLLVNDDKSAGVVADRIKQADAAPERVSLLKIPTVDVWMRDYGPTFVTREAEQAPLAMNDWIFNGWGGKYPSYEDDDGVAKEIASLLRVPVFDQPVVLEGGSIEVNGAGTCLATEQCLLNKNRNQHLTRVEIERLLLDSLSARHVIWLGEGIAGDDTDGHIDDIARFVDPHTIVCVLESDSRDVNYHALQENYERLKNARDQDGDKLNVVTLPCPKAIYCEGARLPASYANFYIANDLVLVPVFDDANDERALGTLRELFAGRKVVGLRCNEVVAGLGAIHCVTQQEPQVKPR